MPPGQPTIPSKSLTPRWLTLALAAGLALTTASAFFGLHQCEFVNLDDADYVVRNPNVNKGLSWSVVAWAFTHSYSCNWHPLTWLSHALDCQLYALNPGGHHITNLILHTLSTIVLFLALRRMTGAQWRSAFVAALFAIHPLHVESVAWVSERKDVLSGLFFMLTLWAYSRHAEIRKSKPEIREKAETRDLKIGDRGHAAKGFNASATTRPRSPRLWYSLALTFFALGLMSKPMLVTLPFVLLLLDHWPLRRLEIKNQPSNLKKLLVEKLPFFALAIASCVITVLAQQASQVTLASVPLHERLGNAVLSCVAYLRQMFWPAGLAPFYAYPKVVPMADAAVAVLVLLGITAVVVAVRKSWPFALTGWLWFLGMLVPVIGIIQVGSQARADRYTYLPSIGVFLAVTWAATALFSAKHRYKLAFIACAAMSALAFTTHLQAQCWRNSRRLFQHAADVIPDNFFALTQLGMADLKSGKMDSAMTNLTRALELEPGYPVANHHMGVALLRQGKAAAAIPFLRCAENVPELRASTLLVLALVYMQTGDLKEARAYLDRAEAEKPGEPDIAVVRANLLVRETKPDEAEKVYHAVLSAHPEHPQAQAGLANFLLTRNRPEEAEPLFAAAVKLQPADVGLRTGLASALGLQKKFGQAIEQLERARTLSPQDSMVHFELAQVLSQAHKTRDAVVCYDRALELNPAFAGAMNNLAWILATDPDDQIRNGRRAVELAEKACELTKWEMPLLMGTLAAAYAEAGRFADAIKTAEKARDKAQVTHEEEIAKKNEKLIELYRSGQPYREAQAATADSK